jgi:phosphopantothenoylcysteine decarboxylase/phosphopantothenate--cysteine ligase
MGEQPALDLKTKTVVVGVTGGIAAYKACEVVSSLNKLGAQVYVIMTQAATKLVQPLTFQTLSGHPVFVDMWEPPKLWNVEHIALAERADLVLVVPATANIVGKIAGGICDDLLSTVVAATTAPVLLCPAMNLNMYANPIYQANERALASLGYHILPPEHGRLASGAVGKGRLPAPPVIVDAALAILGRVRDLQGVPVMVTAGPTREYFDPVRFISNPSTGKMGFAVAEEAARRGADVTLITGPVSLADPAGVRVIRVTTAQEMLDGVLANFSGYGAFIGAAAVSDYRPVTVAQHKIKKGPDMIAAELRRTPDILATVAERKGRAVLVGFAAESDDIMGYAAAKLTAKQLDLVVANDITQPGAGFAVDTNQATLIWPDGRTEHRELESKRSLAAHLMDVLLPLLGERRPDGASDSDPR